jgi:hypothetical protein
MTGRRVGVAELTYGPLRMIGRPKDVDVEVKRYGGHKPRCNASSLPGHPVSAILLACLPDDMMPGNPVCLYREAI